MKPRALLLLCGLWLVASGVAGQLDGGSAGLSFIPRFTRALKQQEISTIASWLLPSKLPDYCPEGKCCQADSYASPYGMKQVAKTKQVLGARTYTTFFFNFTASRHCVTTVDLAGCCTAGVNTIHVDVDPSLKVKYVTFNGQHVQGAAQDEYGLAITGINKPFNQISANGVPVTVTVEGDVDALCPLPSLAPVAGLCEIVVEGLPANAAAGASCCPRTVSTKSNSTWTPPVDTFQCNADLDASAFQLVYKTASAPFTIGGEQRVTYSFTLLAAGSCNDAGVSHCCDASLSYVELRVTNLNITGVTLDGHAVGYTTSMWNEANSASYRSLLVENLNLVADDLGVAGSRFEVTVRVPDGQTSTDLCDAAPDPAQGGCNYYLHSVDGFCCPAGLAIPGIPPPPAGTCKPPTLVSAADTSMALQYYERSSSASTTTFSFLLADHNGASCTKAHCEDVCSWTLFLNPGVVSTLSIGNENPANNGKQIPTLELPQSITFPYGPAGESTMNFYLTMPAGAQSLSDLCARNALPGQNKACGAIVRSKRVQFMVFFDESDRIIAAPPSAPYPTLCEGAKPLSQSCLALPEARFNAQPATTVVDFSVALAATAIGAAPTCLRAGAAGERVTVRLLLSPAAVDQLSTHRDVVPSSDLTLDRVQGATWTVEQATMRIAFKLQGSMAMADVCRQGLLDDQPSGSCVVEVSGSAGCFRGYVSASADGRLIWVGAPGSRAVSAGTVVPAVVVPIVLLLLILIAVVVVYRRRRANVYRAAGSNSSLERPLAGDGSADGRDDLSAPSVAPSDVQVRVSGPSQGGAAPLARQ